ncbi:Polyketide synthase [Lasiodiplodia theobromae]|uniref:Polyketide synthase n=1 Tax=Lasiodiplodia theobromae TaxID=45133 RepID=UPI0015C3D896|nr:Polyketide synthase [Lasiodiplodia theobromae]KAF4545822.1 Polyketide synthase [Lasiodiplodia theobromae]
MDDKQEPIAIIGAACRLPGQASSLGSLWDMISNARTGHGKVPADRWDGDIWHHPDPDRKGGIAVKHGYFLQQDISHFDAPFFSTTAKEAAAMDPMKRLLLEVSYESIENAGIPVESLMNSSTGCYVGCMTNDYEMMSLHDIYDIGHNAASATSEAMTANRVSWFFGLRGPSLTLDTACSSSLYALHLACQSLKLGETNMSLVAGVNLILNPNTMHQLSAMHMLSPEGISHAFDDRANGYGRGEGIGCIVVKRLSDALRDGDTIRAVIRNTGANADGKTPSITSPSAEAQAELIRKTYEAAGLEQTSTQYFECHGTGTPVGDPLELEAIAKTLGASRAAAGLGPLYIGSIKPNVGHTEGCSGLAGVLKAVACLENGMLAPTYDVQRVNPKLKLAEWNLALPAATMQWPTRGQRRISVNSFGFGGANAHAILDDAHHYLTERGLVGNHNTKVFDDDGSESAVSLGSQTPPDTAPHKRLFVFSTKDQAGIQRLASAYADALGGGPDKTDARYLDNLAHTLAARRSALDFRSFAVASSAAELRTKLAGGLPKPKRALRQDSSLVFVFTGQGAQWPAMGRELLANDVFRASVDASQQHLRALGCEWDAVEELEKTADTGSRVHLPEFSQTLCTVLQIALVQLLKSWNVVPGATVGHSSGEIAAAYAAGLVSHADAVKIAYTRGLSSASVARKGAMLAAGLSRDEAAEYLAKAIDTLERLISGDAKFARKLRVQTAYHSPHMREVSDSYVARLGTLTPPPAQPDDVLPTMFSSLTGEPVASAAQLDARYWAANMCNPVEFSAAVSALLARRRTNYAGFIAAASANKAAREAVYTSLLSRGKHGRVDLAAALADLPAYPWNHSKGYWHESYLMRATRYPLAPRTDLLGVPEPLQNPLEPRWRNHLRVSENPWIEDHKITGTILYPAAGMLVMALEGALQTAAEKQNVRGFRFRNTRLSLRPLEGKPAGHFGFVVYSTTTGTSAASGVEDSSVDALWARQSATFKQLQGAAGTEDVDVDDFYAHLDAIGMEYGDTFRNVVALAAVPAHHAAHARVVLPDTKATMPADGFEFPHVMHPATMDSIFHMVLAALDEGRPVREAAVPYHIDEMFVAADQPHTPGDIFTGYGKLVSKSGDGHELGFALRQTAELAWEQDVDFCKTTDSEEPLARWLDPSVPDAIRDAAKLTAKLSAVATTAEAPLPAPQEAYDLSLGGYIATVQGSKPLITVSATASLAASQPPATPPADVYLLLPSTPSPATTAAASALTAALSTTTTVHTAALTPAGVAPLAGKHVISLLELHSPLIYAWTADEFAAFKQVISTATHVLWLTAGGVLDEWSGGVEFAPAQGLLRVLRNEYPLVSLPHLDVSPGFDAASAAGANLVLAVWRRSLVENGAEMEYAEHRGAVAEGVVQPVPTKLAEAGPREPSEALAGGEFLWVEDDEAGRPLAADEVEVVVEAAGGLSSGEEKKLPALASEAAGVVARRGEKSGGCLKTHVRQKESLVAALPDGYALLEVARLHKGQTVLVHTAASALGQAAVQVAQLAGADVVALTFVTHLETTPVDVIFGSAPSPAVEPTLALPASKRNASLVRIDMAAVRRAKPATVAALFQRTFDHVRTSALKPIPAHSTPTTTTVVTFPTSSTVLTTPAPPAPLALDASATYVLAGGLGALGLRIADMMIAHGAKDLVFLSRSGGRKNEADLAAMRERGASVEAVACDVTDAAKVQAVFEGIVREGGVVGGVVQCAMVLQDSIFDNMGWEKWNGAFEPKTRGSWNLLNALSSSSAAKSSGKQPFFILLSSITGIIGNTAQANYAAGNTFEDALARHARTRLGVAATSVDVGLVTDSSHFTAAGEFGELDGYINRYSHGWKGLKTTVPELLVIAAALMRDAAAPAQLVLGLADNLVRRPAAGGFQNDRKFELRISRATAADEGSGGDGAKKAATADLLAQAATLAEATAVVEEDIKVQIAAAVGVAVDEVDAQRPLFDFGVDSLKAVEIRNRSLKELKSDISVFELLSSTPLAELAAKIASRSGLVTAKKEDA